MSGANPTPGQLRAARALQRLARDAEAVDLRSVPKHLRNLVNDVQAYALEASDAMLAFTGTDDDPPDYGADPYGTGTYGA